jgi:ABC-type dipeptide/oligopeptide/nickel transport system permease subunit
MDRRKRSPIIEIAALLWRDTFTRIALIYLALFFAVGLIGIFWTPYDYRAQDFSVVRQGPSAEHWFGTDFLGRDMFTRVLYAIRITGTLVVLTTILGGLPLGILLGVAAGYMGNSVKIGVGPIKVGVETLIMRIGEIFIGIPPLLFILLLTATVRPRYDAMLLGLGDAGSWLVKTGMGDLSLILFVTALIFWVGPARLYRSQVLALRESAFVEGAKMLGASSWRIIWHHILPYPLIAHQAILMFAGVIGTEIALSFFGIGVRPPHPSFGAMFSETASAQILQSSPYLLLIPGTLIVLFLYALMFFELRMTAVLSSVHEREGRGR